MQGRTLKLAALSLVVVFYGCGNIFDFNECTEDSDCGSGRVCLDSLIGSYCATRCACDSECDDARLCMTPGGLSGSELLVCTSSCRTDSDCGDGQVCNLRSCSEGCRTHVDCPLGEACVSGATCEVGCRADTECSEGLVCENGQCIEGCRESGDCEDGEVCVRTNEAAGTCGAGCIDDSECASPEICLCGRCAERCESEDDCSGDEVCPGTAHACEEARCAAPSGSSVVCGERLCPRSADESGEFFPCCIPGESPRCGYKPPFATGADFCGDLSMLGEGDCDCGADECCLDDGGCGSIVHSLLRASDVILCVPPSPAADPECVPLE